MSFVPGQSGNPRGRPKNAGSVRANLDRISYRQAQAILTVVLEKALRGDGDACKLILDRLWPRRAPIPAPVELPKLRAAADIPDALAELVRITAAGHLNPTEAAAFASLFGEFRTAWETERLAERVAALERHANGDGRPKRAHLDDEPHATH